ncbi:hypothetical protein CC1G_00174 [Coprinopsis cinerea okayama7|uniref:Uncharacterized protein n=1 Tax=Coprinopsis cinerea (strain Okayama-7 / 130 / ATCC MYA-4618 / FGSC 9003) TaxID=240176 RepID=A8NX12_COPC7|nr:hypothetical protein CC1G_00174 [Coprinopsis cinerea okayama7\|eukprot:XP_001837038.2 hypothetical protein CC1G_00174 [Coprinopsis cinerea okayama7\
MPEFLRIGVLSKQAFFHEIVVALTAPEYCELRCDVRLALDKGAEIGSSRVVDGSRAFSGSSHHTNTRVLCTAYNHGKPHISSSRSRSTLRRRDIRRQVRCRYGKYDTISSILSRSWLRFPRHGKGLDFRGYLFVLSVFASPLLEEGAVPWVVRIGNKGDYDRIGVVHARQEKKSRVLEAFGKHKTPGRVTEPVAYLLWSTFYLTVMHPIGDYVFDAFEAFHGLSDYRLDLVQQNRLVSDLGMLFSRGMALSCGASSMRIVRNVYKHPTKR